MQFDSTERDTAPGSAAPSSDLPGSLLPVTAAEPPPADPPHQSFWAGAVSESVGFPQALPGAWVCRQAPGVWQVGWDMYCSFPGAVLDSQQVRWMAEGTAPVLFLVPGSDFCGNCRQAVGYNGYTSIHLPVSSCRAPEFKKAEALPAIFAARMARSSLWILVLLR